MDPTRQTTLINPATCFAVACVAFSFFTVTSIWKQQKATSGHAEESERDQQRSEARPKAVRRRAVDSLYINPEQASTITGDKHKNPSNPDSSRDEVIASLIALASSITKSLRNARGLEQARATTAYLHTELSNITLSLCRLQRMLQNKSSQSTQNSSLNACFDIVTNGLHDGFEFLQAELRTMDVDESVIRDALQQLRDQRPGLEFLLESVSSNELPPTPPNDFDFESQLKPAQPTGITPLVDVKGWIEPPPEYTPPSAGSAYAVATEKPDAKQPRPSSPDKDLEGNSGEDIDDLLYQAATDNNDDLVKDLLSRGARADKTSGELQRTALHQAAHFNHCKCLTMLLNNSSDLQNIEDAGGDMAIHLAAWAGHVEALSILLAHSADVDWLSGRDGYSPLWCAISACHIDAARLLLKQGARVSLRSASGGLSPLHQAAATGQSAMCELLVERGAHVDALDDEQNSALHYAAVSGSLAAVTVLLRAGAAIDLQQAQGLQPAHWAAHRGYKDILNILLAYGASVNATTESGASLLHMAANRGHLAASRILLEKGASRTLVGVWDGVEGTPEAMAKAKGHAKVTSTIKTWKAS